MRCCYASVLLLNAPFLSGQFVFGISQWGNAGTLRNLLNGLCSRIKAGERVKAWHHDLKRFISGFIDESDDGWYEVRYLLADIGENGTETPTTTPSQVPATISSDGAGAIMDDSEHLQPTSDSKQTRSSQPTTSSASPTVETSEAMIAHPPPLSSSTRDAVAGNVDMSLYTSDTTTLSFGLVRRTSTILQNLIHKLRSESDTSD